MHKNTFFHVNFLPLASAVSIARKGRPIFIIRFLPADAVFWPLAVPDGVVHGGFLGEINFSFLRPDVALVALLRNRRENGKDHRPLAINKYDERAIHSTRGAASRRHHRGAALAGCSDYADGRTPFPRFCIKDVL